MTLETKALRYDHEGRALMIRTVEAVVDPSGNVRLLEDIQLPGPRRALVTILDDAPGSDETALLSERALADWSRPEEDAAWSHLSGSLRSDSYARPGKLFTASRELMVGQVATLSSEAREQLTGAVVRILRGVNTLESGEV